MVNKRNTIQSSGKKYEDDLDEPVSKIVELVRLSSTFKTGCNRVAE